MATRLTKFLFVVACVILALVVFWSSRIRFMTVPSDKYYGNWGEWNACSKTCGEGVNARTRTCMNPSSDDDCSILGPAAEEARCNLKECPVVIEVKEKEFVIRHFDKKCLSIEDSGRLRLTAACTTKFTFTKDKTLQHVASGKCVVPESNADDTRLKLQIDCKDQNARFEQTARFSTKHILTGKCWHPFGGLATPNEGTQVVMFSGCDIDRLIFKFETPT